MIGVMMPSTRNCQKNGPLPFVRQRSTALARIRHISAVGLGENQPIATTTPPGRT